MSAALGTVSVGNRILAALPHEEFSRIQPQLERIHLEKGKVVYITGDLIRHVYFPVTGLLSLLTATETGSTVELAMVGSEGVVGLPAILKKGMISYEVSVQIPVDAFRIRAEVLRQEFNRGERLQEHMLSYTHALIAQIAQLSICNRFHTIEKALSRWLLVTQERANTETLNFTQENISNALGVPRTAVTMAARNLQSAGLIRYSRGHIVIVDRARLETNSCECYRILHDELQ
ncbi:MAG TPA: Crp/Fnr family transcriptional regulator [Pyrinomonadaceae bacterium]|nr:Crp/Fnr family transcriptional regulator [Pyrinomonadaceae bacterium]